MWFWRDFFPNAAATFLGVVLALLFDHYYRRWRERRRGKEREAVLMNQLRHAFNPNLQVLRFLVGSGPQHIVTQRLDTSLLDLLIPQIVPTLHLDYDFLNYVAEIRYDFNELNRRLDFQAAVLTGPLRAEYLRQTGTFEASFIPVQRFAKENAEALHQLSMKLLEKTERVVVWIDRRLVT